MRSESSSQTAERDLVVVELIELIAALDQRVPHVERVGEIKIAREAAALRKAASTRVEHLTAGSHLAREDEQSNAVMSDDGGPVRRS
jgi:hypothetical protein